MIAEVYVLMHRDGSDTPAPVATFTDWERTLQELHSAKRNPLMKGDYYVFPSPVPLIADEPNKEKTQ